MWYFLCLLVLLNLNNTIHFVACSRKRAELSKDSSRIYASLHCDSMGNYEPLQCDSGLCWCAESKTGDLTSPAVPEKAIKFLPCCNKIRRANRFLF